MCEAPESLKKAAANVRNNVYYCLMTSSERLSELAAQNQCASVPLIAVDTNDESNETSRIWYTLAKSTRNKTMLHSNIYKNALSMLLPPLSFQLSINTRSARPKDNPDSQLQYPSQLGRKDPLLDKRNEPAYLNVRAAKSVLSSTTASSPGDTSQITQHSARFPVPGFVSIVVA